MKNLLRFLGLAALVAVIVFGAASCGDGGGGGPGNPSSSKPTTYTVWTGSISYSEFSDAFGTTLGDGYYIHYEFTSSEWSQISPSITNEVEGRHNWTENEIKNWFIGRGFGNSEATKETAWLMTIDHGFIASRSGPIVYMLLK